MVGWAPTSLVGDGRKGRAHARPGTRNRWGGRARQGWGGLQGGYARRWGGWRQNTTIAASAPIYRYLTKCIAAQASACSSRSLPQNNSPSAVTKLGAPKM